MDYHLVRGLNKPFTRFDFVIGGFCKIADGIIDICSFGYARGYLHQWYSNKTFKRWCTYMEKKIEK